MLTVKDHNDRAVAAYAAVTGQYWIEALKDGRHVLIRPLAEKDREREYAARRGGTVGQHRRHESGIRRREAQLARPD